MGFLIMRGVSVRKDMFMKSLKHCSCRKEICGLLPSTMNVSGRGQNKLRTYRLMKRAYKTKNYCLSCIPLKHRSAFTKFCCVLAPIGTETGRYEGLDVDHRTCPIRKNSIEDEKRHSSVFAV